MAPELNAEVVGGDDLVRLQSFLTTLKSFAESSETGVSGLADDQQIKANPSSCDPPGPASGPLLPEPLRAFGMHQEADIQTRFSRCIWRDTITEPFTKTTCASSAQV